MSHNEGLIPMNQTIKFQLCLHTMFRFGIFWNMHPRKQSKKIKKENFSHCRKELKWQNAFVMVYFIWTRRRMWLIGISNSGPFSQCFVLFKAINFQIEPKEITHLFEKLTVIFWSMFIKMSTTRWNGRVAMTIRKVLSLPISESQHQSESVNISVLLELRDGLHQSNGSVNLWSGESWWFLDSIFLSLMWLD